MVWNFRSGKTSIVNALNDYDGPLRRTPGFDLRSKIPLMFRFLHRKCMDVQTFNCIISGCITCTYILVDQSELH